MMGGLANMAANFRARFLGTREAELRALYRRVFETEDGQAVFEDLCKTAGIGRETLVPGAPDLTAFGLGMQRIVLHIQGYLDMSDRQLLRMAHDANEQQEEQSYG